MHSNKYGEKSKKGLQKNLLPVGGVRQLETATGLSYNIVHGVYSAKRDLQLTTLITLVTEGFGLTFAEFAKLFDSITEDEIKSVKTEIEKSKRKPTVKKSSLAPKKK